jgi:hypothetical protein
MKEPDAGEAAPGGSKAVLPFRLHRETGKTDALLSAAMSGCRGTACHCRSNAATRDRFREFPSPARRAMRQRPATRVLHVRQGVS